MNLKQIALVLALATFVLPLVACGPPQLEKIQEIQPSETAFLIQLEGDTKQQDVFRSVEFLEKNKVAVKRVSLPQRKVKTGRMWWNYEWKPTALLITVDRKPITREWVASEGGTAPSNQAIQVESKESVGFAIGVNATASIPESDAGKFLYFFSGKTLEDVMDQNVRGFLQTVLSREFGDRTLSEGRNAKREIFEIALRETRAYFKERGVSIDYLGSSEGLTYDNPAIQEAIDAVFRAERDVEQAKQQKLAQEERNMLLVAKAIAEREAAQEFARAQEAAVARTRLEIEMIRAQAELKSSEATLAAAAKWNGQLPTNIMPQGSNMLFGLDPAQQSPR